MFSWLRGLTAFERHCRENNERKEGRTVGRCETHERTKEKVEVEDDHDVISDTVVKFAAAIAPYHTFK